MGVNNSQDIFHQKMDDLFHVIEFTRAYVYGILILSKGYWTYYVNESEMTPNKIKESEPKCDIEKSFFGQTEMEYLGFWVTHDGVKSMDKNTSNKK